MDKYVWSSHRAYAGIEQKPQWLSFTWLDSWGNTRKIAHKNYRKFIDQTFGRRIEDPLQQLKGSLVLGSNGFREKIQALLSKKEGEEERRWVTQAGREETQKRIRELAEKEPDQKKQIWIRVRLGGERMTEVGRSMGYKDGSGVLYVIKRLEKTAEEDVHLARQLNHLKKQVLSSFKS